MISETVLFLHGPFVRTARLLLEGFLSFADSRGWHVKNLCPPKGSGAAYLRRIVSAWNAVGVAVDCGAEAAMPLPGHAPDVPFALIDLDLSKRAKLFGGIAPQSRIGFVNSDSEDLVRTAASELVGRDFASYAYVSAYYARHWSRRRSEVFRAMVEEAGGEYHYFSGRRQETGDAPDVRRLGDWLKSLPKPCGLLAANDRIAALVLSAAMRCGVVVPDMVSIVGIDNDEMLCESMHPSLSSVQPDFTGGGRMTGELLEGLLEGRVRSGTTILYGAKRFAHRLSTRQLKPNRPSVRNALDFIRRHAAEGVSASDVLPLLGGSRRSAEKRFRSSTGKSILEEIMDIRFEKVTALLERRHVQLSSIAGQAGFTSENQLQRRFKARFGMTMLEYRKKSHL